LSEKRIGGRQKKEKKRRNKPRGKIAEKTNCFKDV
jgi:hypothetical protein